MVFYILADLISFLEIQRSELTGSSSTAFAANLTYIGFPVVRTDGRAAGGQRGGIRSRDYQIFWDGKIYLAMGLGSRSLRAPGAPLLPRKTVNAFCGGTTFPIEHSRDNLAYQ